MLHLRLIVPRDLRAETEELLAGDDAVANLVVLEGAARNPVGDVVLCDVAREGASPLIARLRAVGVEERGSIAIEHIDASISGAARRAKRQAPGNGSDAVVWEEIEAQTSDEGQLSGSFLALMAVALMIAGIGVLLDQPILIVGAMVVGPDFGPLAALSVAIVRFRPAIIWRSVLALVVGYGFGMVLTLVSTAFLTWLGLVDRSMLLGDRPLTSFIWEPDALSWVVASLAGVAGIVSMTSAKSGALVGVLISVTTVPAAANAAVAAFYGEWEQFTGSMAQLGINLAAIVLAAVLALLFERVWRNSGRLRGNGPGSL